VLRLPQRGTNDASIPALNLHVWKFFLMSSLNPFLGKKEFLPRWTSFCPSPILGDHVLHEFPQRGGKSCV